MEHMKDQLGPEGQEGVGPRDSDLGRERLCTKACGQTNPGATGKPKVAQCDYRVE